MYSNAADMPKSRNAEERKRNIQAASKQEHNNPCTKEQKISLKCLSENNYDKDSCTAAFSNYKTCREFWDKVKIDRRIRGITPALPPPEEREAIKAEYLAKVHGSKPNR